MRNWRSISGNAVEEKRHSLSAKENKKIKFEMIRSFFRYMMIFVFLVMVWTSGINTGMAAKSIVLLDEPPGPFDLQTAIKKYRLDSFPASLEKKRGVHPRLFLTKERVKELRAAIKTTHAPFWEELRKQADDAVKSGPPKYQGNGTGRWGFEQGWERGAASRMETVALAYVLTGQQQYLDSVRDYARAICGYETWGGYGWLDGMDLATGHQLCGLGLVYDWCYDDLGDELRQTIRETLVRRASAMFEATATEKRWWPRSDVENNYWVIWQRGYLQNHLWINMCGVGVAGIALFEEVDETHQWIGLALDKFERTMVALGPDGASHEGVGYWAYGIEHLLKFMDISRDLLDVDMYATAWFRKTALYRQYTSLPTGAWDSGNNAIDIGDCGRSNWNIHQLYALAKEYKDGHAQWLAQQLNKNGSGSNRGTWINLLWYDLAVPEKSPSDLPTLYHFDDIDIVSARSDWSGNESLVFFKCGPYIGHKAIQEVQYSPAASHHVHPDANNFILFGAGEWLIRDDGYRSKWTDQHNTFLINGKGQTGEGLMLCFDGRELHRRKARPRILQATSTPEFDQITGDATEAYPLDSGLIRFVRHLLYVKPDVLIVVDDIVADSARDLELRFHPEQKKAENENGSFLITGEKAVLRLDPLTREGVDIVTEDIPSEFIDGSMGQDMMFTVRMKTNRANWRNAVALSWTKANDKPVKVTLDKNGDTWIFKAADRTVVLNMTTGKAEIRR